MKNSVAHIAMRDISDYLGTLENQIVDCNNDVWFVTPNQLYTKEQRLLNKKLGLNKTNMARKQK